ncbi:MAG TPA: hypothetical protein VKF32_00970, partial [Thermoanaerobaculia bacterium]|nr:hypothetical protein [Thermoanaerobaculia bacterium]
MGIERRVNVNTVGDEAHPSAAPIADVEYVVAFDGPGLTSQDILARRVNLNGAPISSVFRVNTYTSFTQDRPVVAADLAGNFVVIWRRFSTELVGQRFSFDATPLGGEFQINTSTFTVFNPTVARAPGGDFMVVWHSSEDGDYTGVQARRYAAGGAPAAPAFRVNTYTTGRQSYASVAAGSSGFLVMWASDSRVGEDKTGVYAQRYLASGATVGGEFHVNTGTTGYTDSQNAAIRRSDGSFVIVWRGLDGTTDGVFGQRFDPSGALLGGEFAVNTTLANSQRNAVVAFDTDSTFVVIWQSGLQDGSGGGIYGRRYLFSGAPVSGEFRVNTTTTGYQYPPAVASVQTHGRYLVSWGGPDGDQGGVFDQAFCYVGDADSDGKIDVADVFFLINLLFANGPPTVG